MKTQGSTKPEREGKGKELNRGAMVREIHSIAGFQNEGRDLSCMAKTEAQDLPAELLKMTEAQCTSVLGLTLPYL